MANKKHKTNTDAPKQSTDTKTTHENTHEQIKRTTQSKHKRTTKKQRKETNRKTTTKQTRACVLCARRGAPWRPLISISDLPFC